MLKVTGANSGIGQQVAIEAAKLGANVTLIARNEERLQATIELIENCKAWTQKPKTQFYSLDLSKDFENIKKVFSLAETKFGPVYMLVNCAGMAVCGSIEDSPIEDYHLMLSLNLMGTVHATKAVLGDMKKREEGIIVVTSSLAALFGIYGYPAYTCSKFGLRGFAETLRMEVKPYNITVTLALPPDTDTPGFANEEKTKPEETKLISGSAGLISPDVVAKQILKDALAGNFYSTVGLTGTMLKNATAGMAPFSSICEVITQVNKEPRYLESEEIQTMREQTEEQVPRKSERLKKKNSRTTISTKEPMRRSERIRNKNKSVMNTEEGGKEPLKRV